LKKRSLKIAGSETSQAALLPCMDYLHGDVADNEFEAACYYEYAKESALLREMARSWASNKHFHKEIEKKSLVWQCPSFPGKSWNELTQVERANILLGFLSTQIQPLRVIDVWHLNAMGIFDQLKTMVAEAMESKRLHKPQRKVYPIIEAPVLDLKKARRAWVHVIFTLDFVKTKKRLLQEFDKWLQLPQNKARFAAHKQSPIGKTGVFKDRLKDLAAWRLYRELGCRETLAFAEKNRKRGEQGKFREFHDARKEQSKTKMPLNEAPLYSEESGFLKAKARALAYGKELIPWAFRNFADDTERLRNEVAESFRTARKQALEDF
jgi:hypothetical protein